MIITKGESVRIATYRKEGQYYQGLIKVYEKRSIGGQFLWSATVPIKRVCKTDAVDDAIKHAFEY